MDALHVDKRDVACVLAVEALRRGGSVNVGCRCRPGGGTGRRDPVCGTVVFFPIAKALLELRVSPEQEATWTSPGHCESASDLRGLQSGGIAGAIGS